MTGLGVFMRGGRGGGQGDEVERILKWLVDLGMTDTDERRGGGDGGSGGGNGSGRSFGKHRGYGGNRGRGRVGHASNGGEKKDGGNLSRGASVSSSEGKEGGGSSSGKRANQQVGSQGRAEGENVEKEIIVLQERLSVSEIEVRRLKAQLAETMKSWDADKRELQQLKQKLQKDEQTNFRSQAVERRTVSQGQPASKALEKGNQQVWRPRSPRTAPEPQANVTTSHPLPTVNASLASKVTGKERLMRSKNDALAKSPTATTTTIDDNDNDDDADWTDYSSDVSFAWICSYLSFVYLTCWTLSGAAITSESPPSSNLAPFITTGQ